MTYESRKKKISGFAVDDTLTSASTFDFIKDGINKKTSWQNILDKFSEVYGLGARIFETQADLVASDIQIDEHAIVVSNNYGLYKITSLSPSGQDVTLASGFIATLQNALDVPTPADYTELRAITTAGLPDGAPITVTNSGIAGDFVLVNSVAHGLTDNGGTIIVINANWYAERIYNGAVNVQWFGATGNGSTDDRNAIQAAISFVDLGGPTEKHLYFPQGRYLCLNGFGIVQGSNITFSGDGMIQTEIIADFSGAGYFFNIQSCNAVTIRDMAIGYANGTFTGTVVRTYNSSRMQFSRVKFYGDGLTNAFYLVDTDLSTNITFDTCWFSGAAYCVRGWDTIPTTAVTFTCCFFDRYIAYAIRNLGQGFVIQGCAVEPNITYQGQFIYQDEWGTASGATTDSAGYAPGATVITLAAAGTGNFVANDTVFFAGSTIAYKVAVGNADVSTGGTITLEAPGLLHTIPASATAVAASQKMAIGIAIHGNWMGDANSVTGYTWMVLNGKSISITGNYINGDGNNTCTAVGINMPTDNLTVQNNYIGSCITGVAQGINWLTSSSVEFNSYSSVTNRVTGSTVFGDDIVSFSESTFTPTLGFGGASTGITYSKNNGKYVKQGKLITYHIDIVLTSKGSSTGAAVVSGLPFTSSADVGFAANINYWAILSTPLNLSGFVNPSSTSISLGERSGVTFTAIDDTDFTDTTQIAISGFYFLA